MKFLVTSLLLTSCLLAAAYADNRFYDQYDDQNPSSSNYKAYGKAASDYQSSASQSLYPDDQEAIASSNKIERDSYSSGGGDYGGGYAASGYGGYASPNPLKQKTVSLVEFCQNFPGHAACLSSPSSSSLTPPSVPSKLTKQFPAQIVSKKSGYDDDTPLGGVSYATQPKLSATSPLNPWTAPSSFVETNNGLAISSDQSRNYNAQVPALRPYNYNSPNALGAIRQNEISRLSRNDNYGFSRLRRDGYGGGGYSSYEPAFSSDPYRYFNGDYTYYPVPNLWNMWKKMWKGVGKGMKKMIFWPFYLGCPEQYPYTNGYY